MKSKKVVAGQIATEKQYNDLREDARLASNFLTTPSDIEDNKIIIFGGTIILKNGNILTKNTEIKSINIPNNNNQIALISVNFDNGDIVITYGNEEDNPSIPEIPAYNSPISYIYLRPNSVIKEEDDSVNSYIVDLRQVSIDINGKANLDGGNSFKGEQNVDGVIKSQFTNGMIFTNKYSDNGILLGLKMFDKINDGGDTIGGEGKIYQWLDTGGNGTSKTNFYHYPSKNGSTLSYHYWLENKYNFTTNTFSTVLTDKVSINKTSEPEEALDVNGNIKNNGWTQVGLKYKSYNVSTVDELIAILKTPNLPEDIKINLADGTYTITKDNWGSGSFYIAPSNIMIKGSNKANCEIIFETFTHTNDKRRTPFLGFTGTVYFEKLKLTTPTGDTSKNWDAGRNTSPIGLSYQSAFAGQFKRLNFAGFRDIDFNINTKYLIFSRGNNVEIMFYYNTYSVEPSDYWVNMQNNGMFLLFTLQGSSPTTRITSGNYFGSKDSRLKGNIKLGDYNNYGMQIGISSYGGGTELIRFGGWASDNKTFNTGVSINPRNGNLNYANKLLGKDGTVDIGRYLSQSGDAQIRMKGGGWSRLTVEGGTLAIFKSFSDESNSYPSFLFQGTSLGVGTNSVGGNLLNKSLAIGDSDTGFKWNGDGNLSGYANNAHVFNWSASDFNIYKKLSITSNNGIQDIHDVRGHNYGPDWEGYRRLSTHKGFVERTTVGLPDNGEGWCMVETVNKWDKSSQSHKLYQTTLNGDKMFIRSNTDGTHWGNWKEIGESRLLYVSSPVNGSDDANYTFTHNLNLNETDVENGRYNVELTYKNGSSGGHTTLDTQGLNFIGQGGSNYNFYMWSTSNPSDRYTAYFSQNEVRIKLGSHGGDLDNIRLLITKNF